MSLSLVVLMLVVLALVASMALYALRGCRPDPDAQGKNAQFAGGHGDFLLHWFLWLVSPATAVSLRIGLTADFYNFAGLALGIGAGGALAAGCLAAAGWALALSGVCDIMDGRIARATGATSRYGAFIDAVLDRYIELFFFLGFAFFLRQSAQAALAASLGVGASMLVSYARAVGESLGVDCTGGLMQRGERLTLLSLACLTDGALSAFLGRPEGSLLLATVYFIGLTSLLTAVHRTAWIAGRLRSGADPKAPAK